MANKQEKVVHVLDWRPMPVKDVVAGTVIKVDRPDGGADIYMATTGALESDDGEHLELELEKVCITKDMLIAKAVIKVEKESRIVRPDSPKVKVQ